MDNNVHMMFFTLACENFHFQFQWFYDKLMSLNCWNLYPNAVVKGYRNYHTQFPNIVTMIDLSKIRVKGLEIH